MELPSLTPVVGRFWPALVTALIVVVVYWLGSRVLDRGSKTLPTHSLWSQLGKVALANAGALAVIIALPIESADRGQILQFVAIVLSASIALASTNVLGNALSGLMLRALRCFRTGDLIEVDGLLGRVTERGLLHTEIQTADHNLSTLPNLWLTSRPLAVMPASGTIVATTVSLGYDLERREVERLLLEAAAAIELREPFVQVCELGDHAVTYRIAGLLDDAKKLISTRSRLRGAVLDALHDGEVEIVSPGFVNLRALEKEARFVPPSRARVPSAAESSDSDHVVFDKAERLEARETELERVKLEIERLKKRQSEAHGDEKKRVASRLDVLATMQEQLEQQTQDEHESRG